MDGVFLKHYELEFEATLEGNNKSIGHKEHKFCRFCKRQFPEVTFKMDAHIVPELIGRNRFCSYYECDSCNSKHSVYENALGQFIGPYRTLLGLKGKKKSSKSGIPVFKNPRTNSRFSADAIPENNLNSSDQVPILLNLDDLSSSDSMVKESEGIWNLTIQKNTYIPIFVFKSLLKIAFSLLSEDEVKNYEYTRLFLQTPDDSYKKYIQRFKNMYALFCFSIISYPELFSVPRVEIYKRKESCKLTGVVERNLILKFKCFVYQIPLVFSSNDLNEINETGLISVFPFINNTPSFQWNLYDLSSYKPELNDKLAVQFESTNE